MIVSGAVEGNVDEAVLGRIVEHVGACLGRVYGRRGKPALLRRVHGYNNAAQYSPWAVIVDLDGDCQCAPPCRDMWLACPAPHMCFRIAVREVEAWLLADRERSARFLGVAQSRIPFAPESIAHPKETVVNLARRSNRREVREGLVPPPGSGRKVGPLYVSLIREFVTDCARGWRPDRAARVSDSLASCLSCLQRLAR